MWIKEAVNVLSFTPALKETVLSTEHKWIELIWAEQSRIIRSLSLCSAAFKSRRSALHDDLWPLDGPPLSFSFYLSVTSTPVGLTLLNKASSKITQSCLSALLQYKSFIKHRGESRSISNHQHRKEISMCVCSLCFFWVIVLMTLLY